jgi:5-methyltetrahydropteroyltriglutamate--homocysteine methyltransferase
MNRILTSHVGSLPRPVGLLDLMKARLEGKPVNAAEYDAVVSHAVANTVEQQVECGLDIVSDGEMSKPGFFSYIRERLTGFEPRPDLKPPFFEAERAAFPEYYEQYFQRAMLGGAVAPMVPMVCVGPIRYVGQDALQIDLDNLKSALAGVECAGAFVPATAPSGAGQNEYYPSDEAYFEALGEALREEYRAIVAAGFQLQIDDPFLSDIFGDAVLSARDKRKKADLYVQSINHALRDIAEEQIRFHTCYGINQGPRITEAPFAEIAPYVLKVNARVYSFEAANPRHEHEYHVWESLKLPEGKVIMPGVVAHASNIVEHPELIAEWLVRFAERVGRENVFAGTDCGFSSQACYQTEVHPTVIVEKFKAMVEGARIASGKLWP